MNEIKIEPLEWDTNYFKARCGKVVIKDEEATFFHFEEMKKDYEFISIQNIDNNIRMNKKIAENTNAYLVDINVQFEKKLPKNGEQTQSKEHYRVVAANEISEEILSEMRVEEDDFAFSKFVCDPELKKRNGYLVYKEWLKNACTEKDKYFIIHFAEGKVGAYMLFNIDDAIGKVEIVKVNRENQGQHIATEMMNEVENFLVSRNTKKFIVGTQLNNIPAMNLYHSLGFKETSRTSVFHLWVKKEQLFK